MQGHVIVAGLGGGVRVFEAGRAVGSLIFACPIGGEHSLGDRKRPQNRDEAIIINPVVLLPQVPGFYTVSRETTICFVWLHSGNEIEGLYDHDPQ